ncbi:hypothetical protein N7X57_04395 [Lactiplantibacillus paraplantarum]|nr:hypothetical protein [Lactiplantibacillus paraplantarum]MCW1909700.1 hypothetical protein [Lactiplantibacillus paraplantarum]
MSNSQGKASQLSRWKANALTETCLDYTSYADFQAGLPIIGTRWAQI